MKNKLKKQSGVISVFAMLSMLFFLLFILGAYLTISRVNKTQKESNKELLKLYSTEVNSQEIYNDKVAKPNEVIPIYSYDQLQKIGSNEIFVIDGRIYCFRSDRNYELKSNLNVSKQSKYKNLSLGQYKYSNQESLRVSLDGENNTGDGHDATKKKWYNLAWSGENLFGIQKEFQLYGGGNSYDNIFTWKSNGLVFDGSGDYVLINNALQDDSQEMVLEAVFRISDLKEQVIISNASAEIGIDDDYNLYGYIDGKDFSYGYLKPETPIKINKDKIYHTAITYDGKESCLYLNGKLVCSSTSCATNTISFKTLGEQSFVTDKKKIGLGIKAYIGEPELENSERGITLKFVVPNVQNYRTLIEDNNRLGDSNFKISSSYYYEDEIKKDFAKPLFYYKNFSNLDEEIKLKFRFDTNYLDSGNEKQGSISFDNVQIGSNETDKAIEIVAKGTDSVIIKSNVGEIDNWYSSNATNKITPDKQTKSLGSFYYSFKNLTPLKDYKIWGTYSVSQSTTLKGNSSTVYVGKKLNGDAVKSFSGVIYAVRCYDKMLNADNIMTNYKIDKSRFSIID